MRWGLLVLFVLFVLSLRFYLTSPRYSYRSWYWQLTGPLDLSRNVDLYDVDLFEVSKDQIETLHKKGIIVICYFSAGTYEPYRPDSAHFPNAVIGNSLKDWPDEKWLNVVEYSKFKDIMLRRLKLAKQKKCDGVELDNTDAYSHRTGFSISRQDEVRYVKWLAGSARKMGLLVAFKNSPEILPNVLDVIDLVIVEECIQYNECSKYLSARRARKSVLDVEYSGDLEVICKKAGQFGIVAAKACKELNGCWQSCEGK